MAKKRYKLKAIRLQNGLTLQEVGERIGFSKQFISQLENGHKGLTYSTAVKIASVFGKKPDDIFLSDELTKD